MSEDNSRSIVIELSEKCQALELKVCKLINATIAKKLHLLNCQDEYLQLNEQFEKFLADHESTRRDEIIKSKRINEDLEKKLDDIARLNAQLSEQVQAKLLNDSNSDVGFISSAVDMKDIFSIPKRLEQIQECSNSLSNSSQDVQQDMEKMKSEVECLISEMKSLSVELSQNDAVLQVSQSQHKLAEQQLDTMAVQLPYEPIEEPVLDALIRSDNFEIRNIANNIKQMGSSIVELNCCLENQAKERLDILDELVGHVNTFARRREEALTLEQQ